MKKGSARTYHEIEEFAEEGGYDLKEHGEELVGEFFIVLKKDSGYGTVVSFVMTSLNSYTCIYSDVKA